MPEPVEQPEWLKALSDAVGEFGKAMEKTGHILTAQGAMGWMVQGELEKAREALAGLPVEQLQAVSVAAAALASLADEVAMEKKP